MRAAQSDAEVPRADVGAQLHAREISCNGHPDDSAGALCVFDNCNSLHTNAYDEALTTPPRRVCVVRWRLQMIITPELGLNKTRTRCRAHSRSSI